jgi:SAM-dependent methyltransferase
MRLDDRFDDLVISLGGFYRTWFVYVGLELGLFRLLREARPAGLAPDQLATQAGCDSGFVAGWAWGAAAHDLVYEKDGRYALPDDVATVLLDADQPGFLGGQFVHAATASLDYATLLDAFRSGRPAAWRPDRYRVAIERLTVQDVAVFFQEALAALPQLVADLRPGTRVADLHCGGGRWLVAMARRFPGTQLVGVEFEPDSLERARRTIEEAGLGDRITLVQSALTDVGRQGDFDLVYFQYSLHGLADPVTALRAAWAATRPTGRLLVMDWYVPSDPEEMRSRQGELIAGVQLDELFQGTRLVSREEAVAWVRAADLPDPEVIDLPSGATVLVVQRP